MAKYKTKDTDPEVLADEADDSSGTQAIKGKLAVFLSDQKPEFQSAYADYQARMGQQKGAAVADPEEYYKILSAMAHAHAQAKKQSQQQPQQPQQQPAPQGRYTNQGTQAVLDQGQQNFGTDLSKLQDK